jgi:heat shock protein HslJ
VLGAVIAVAPGCAQDAEAQPAPDHGLTGTTWRLVEFQSGDDAVGAVRPPDPDRYTLRFHEGGRADVRLDCNRGTGKWASRVDASGLAGGIEIGPLAVTRALCPPPSIGEELGREIGFVQSFRIENERLHLDVVGNGGTFVWEAE